MRNFKRQTVWKNVMQSKPVLILLGILILFFAWNVLVFWNKMQETEKNKKNVEENVASLEQREKELSSEINNLNTEAGKEEFIRENYGLAKQGEDEIVIVNDPNSPPPPAPTQSGFWSFIKNLFKL